jgi:hypothetical protein
MSPRTWLARRVMRVTANVPTTNPWPIIEASLALILLGIAVLSTGGRNRRQGD